MTFFFFGSMGARKTKSFIDNINKMHPTIKLTADGSKTNKFSKCNGI